MRKTVTIIAILISQLASGQKNEAPSDSSFLKELAANACKCIDSINVYDKDKKAIAAEINECIDEQTGAYQLGSKLFGIDSLKNMAEEKEGKKDINISINMNKESDEYKQYYYKMERYLMENCSAVKSIIASNDKQSHKSLSSNPEAMDYYSKGLDETKKGSFQAAIKHYEKAVKIDAQFAFAWDNMGVCYRRLEQYDKALEAYQKSLEIDPNGQMPLQNMAIVYQYKKEYQKAIEAYLKLSELDKNNPEVYYGIGNIYTSFLSDYEKGLSNMCKAYNLYIEQKSPYRTDAEKIINIIYVEMKKQDKEARFWEILKENNIRNQ